jgi:hypothetical protein
MNHGSEAPGTVAFHWRRSTGLASIGSMNSGEAFRQRLKVNFHLRLLSQHASAASAICAMVRDDKADSSSRLRDTARAFL